MIFIEHSQFRLDFLKKGRGGVWQKTVYGFQRLDLCTSLFDVTEIWHTYLKKLPVEQRVCPFYKGVSGQKEIRRNYYLTAADYVSKNSKKFLLML